MTNSPAPIMAKPVVVIGGPTGPSGGPTGPTGAPGPAATIGPQGPPGPTGSIGTGPTGPQGHTGTDGPQGSTGPPGSFGGAGYTGPTGSQGAPGVSGMGFKTAIGAGPYGPNGTAPTLIGLTILHNLQFEARVAVEISGMVRNSAGGSGGGVNLVGRYGLGLVAPPAGETVELGLQFPVPAQFFTIDPQGYYGFTVRMHTTLSAGTWWFDLAISSTAGNNAYVRDVYLTLIEF